MSKNSYNFASAIEGRNNNFNLIRLLAAIIVMYDHCFSLQKLPSGPEPIRQFLIFEGPGSISVCTFFLISGILISQSMERSGSARTFLMHRLARIWPGMVFAMLVAFLITVPLTSGISIRRLFVAPDTISCLLKNLTIINGVCIDLSLAFRFNKLGGAFDYPLWTLPIELHCYALILVYGLVSRSRFSRTWAERLLFTGFTIFCSLCLYLICLSHIFPDIRDFKLMWGASTLPMAFFLIGMGIYAFRDLVVLDGRLFLLIGGTYFWFHESIICLYPAVIYSVLFLSVWPPLRLLKPKFDYSYGLYINGFIVQQVVAQMLPQISGITNFVLALPLAASIAALSWHVCEGPSLKLVRKIKLGENRIALAA